MGKSGTEIEVVASVKGTHFTGALAQNAVESESLDVPSHWSTIKISKYIIEGLTIQADQALEWDVYLWGDSTYNNADMTLAKLIDQVNFPAAGGLQIAGTGQFHYASPTLEIPYEDSDNTSKIHVSLVNRSATAKNAGATGEVTLRFTLRPVWGV